MNADEFEAGHLNNLLAMDLPTEIGPSYVQRTCLVGYNCAVRILERGVDDGKLVPVQPFHCHRFRRRGE